VVFGDNQAGYERLSLFDLAEFPDVEVSGALQLSVDLGDVLPEPEDLSCQGLL
jgi:hypothetical protein